MVKYSKELRLQVVMEIKVGESINGAARKFNIDRNVVREW